MGILTLIGTINWYHTWYIYWPLITSNQQINRIMFFHTVKGQCPNPQHCTKAASSSKAVSKGVMITGVVFLPLPTITWPGYMIQPRYKANSFTTQFTRFLANNKLRLSQVFHAIKQICLNWLKCGGQRMLPWVFSWATSTCICTYVARLVHCCAYDCSEDLVTRWADNTSHTATRGEVPCGNVFTPQKLSARIDLPLWLIEMRCISIQSIAH